MHNYCRPALPSPSICRAPRCLGNTSCAKWPPAFFSAGTSLPQIHKLSECDGPVIYSMFACHADANPVAGKTHSRVKIAGSACFLQCTRKIVRTSRKMLHWTTDVPALCLSSILTFLAYRGLKLQLSARVSCHVPRFLHDSLSRHIYFIISDQFTHLL